LVVRATSATCAGTDRLHFVAIPYPERLFGDYLAAALAHDDYPELIASSETVDTVAVSAVLNRL
jgi:hypothetical protein